ncbi:hypothetical protein D3C79_1053130 [compost metagenome]
MASFLGLMCFQRFFLSYSRGAPSGRDLNRRCAHRYCSGHSRNTLSTHWLMRRQSASSLSPGKSANGGWMTRR